ncbi:MAG: succinyl-CoA--3-ketoacid-CoA transferase [Chloroflexi bacterium RBG_13_46_9]|nr:MAG: succinyl-CoA--3-ketoacid-CoA transferase [Chloroflexi bacterium RBG_13_46_9]
MNKVYTSPASAVADIPDGATIMVGGFGVTGVPFNLIKALANKGSKNLTIISNSGGGRLPDLDLSLVMKNGQAKKLITTYPVYTDRFTAFEERFLKGEIEMEMVPQGTFAERIRAGGAGIPAFYTPTGSGTKLAEGKEVRIFHGKPHVLEHSLRADFALIRAHKADILGNLVYHRAARNFNPVMATAAEITIVEVAEIVDAGQLDPEAVVTPAIYVDRIVIGEKHEIRFD